MARGNQREKSREANAKKQAALAVSSYFFLPTSYLPLNTSLIFRTDISLSIQKAGSGMSRSQMQAEKDKTRVLLMEKQKKGA